MSKKSKLSRKKRISLRILSFELSVIQDLIHQSNYGYALQQINQILDRLNSYDWDKLKEIELQ
jgi:hypothetical protein